MKTRLVDTIVNNEEHVRLKIYDGDLDIGEAGAELLRIERAQALAERQRLLKRIEQLEAPSPRIATKAELLDVAKAAVADRGLNYGRPEDNFERIARLWSVHVRNRYADRANSEIDMSVWDGRFDAADVAQMMVLMKVARLENDPSHIDSWTDIAGYAACGAELTNSENSS